jgi:NTP pyrophosphatase (non-canonical NTP hydrolase)
MSKGDSETTIQELKDLMREFRTARGWDEEMTLKNVAISISLEAAELLEHFQFDTYKDTDQQEITDELADVALTCMSFADISGIDLASAVRDKLDRAKLKYPTEIFNPKMHSNDEYFRIKKAYRSGEKD